MNKVPKIRSSRPGIQEMEDAITHWIGVGKDLCKVCGLPFTEHETCPGCGYSYCDCFLQGDHYLCGKATPEKPKRPTEFDWQAVENAELLTDSDRAELLRFVKYMEYQTKTEEQ